MFGWGGFYRMFRSFENVVCSLMVDSKSKVFGVGEVIDAVRFGHLEKPLQVTAYFCRFADNLKL